MQIFLRDVVAGDGQEDPAGPPGPVGRPGETMGRVGVHSPGPQIGRTMVAVTPWMRGRGMERIAGRRRRIGVLSWGRNPLRRKVDRIEAGIFTGLLVTFLIGAPLLAVAAGWWEHGAAVSQQRAQRSVHLVTAVLLQDVPDIVVGTGTWDAGALARWTVSDGTSRVGLVLDTAGSKAGSMLPIWVDGSGRPTDPPVTRHDVRSRVITAAALAAAAFAITLLAAAIWLRWLLNRRRLASWGAAWADIGPR